MAKLYPPNIKGIIPAFSGTTLVVPFSMNAAVGAEQIGGFFVKIKTIAGKVVETTEVTNGINTMIKNGEIKFTLKEKYSIGTHYKIQVAYKSKADNEEGYYSNVGVAKYTATPLVYIEGLEDIIVNTHIYNYIGVYKQKGTGVSLDPSEKLYSSRFVVKDSKGKIYKDSGEIIHNTINDTFPSQANEQFNILEDLKDEEIFTIQFSIKTVNLMEVKSKEYRIKQRKSIAAREVVGIKAEMDYDNGCMNLSMVSPDHQLNGSFIITRSDNKNNYLDWSEIFRFTVENSIDPNSWVGKDYSVEQGVYYKYAIQQYNQYNVYSEKMQSTRVYADFEDSFLYDGKKCFNIRFNPKVSTYKINLQEQKTETIGSQFPKFSRNSNVRYKEFSISGLISYLSDPDFLFANKKDVEYTWPQTDLVSSNMASERFFKNQLFDWLTDGKPKLFKSPGEGNYIVRLMNVSLSPIDTVGRMLHTFNCAAYEVDNYSIENLKSYGLIGKESSIPYPSVHLAYIDLNYYRKYSIVSKFNNDYLSSSNPSDALTEFHKVFTKWNSSASAYKWTSKGNIKSIRYVEAEDKKVNDKDHTWIDIVHVKAGDQELYLQPNKLYEFDDENGVDNLFIYEPNPTDVKICYDGRLEVIYYQHFETGFDIITKIESEDIPLMQFFGHSYSEDNFIIDNNGEEKKSYNILDFIEDARTTISKLYMVRIALRDAATIYLSYNPDKSWANKSSMLKYLQKFVDNREQNKEISKIALMAKLDGSQDKHNELRTATRFWANKKMTKQIINFNYFYPNKWYKIVLVNEKDSSTSSTEYFIDGFTYEVYKESPDMYYAHYIQDRSDVVNEKRLAYDELKRSLLQKEIDGKKLTAEETKQLKEIRKDLVMIKGREHFEFPNPEKLTYLSIGRLLKAEISFNKIVSHYSIEDTEPLYELKHEYLRLLENSLIMDTDYRYELSTFKDEAPKLFDKSDPNPLHKRFNKAGGSEYFFQYHDKAETLVSTVSSLTLRQAYYRYIKELTTQLKNYETRSTTE